MRDRTFVLAVRWVAVVLGALAVVAGVLAPLPDVFDPDVLPAAIAADVLPWLVVLVVWELAALRGARSAATLARLPLEIFRASLRWGGSAVLVAQLALAVITIGTHPALVLVMTTIESILYELGILALAAIVAYAGARRLLRRVLAEDHQEAALRDIAVRTRFVVMTTGASFATAGILLNVVVDFQTTSDLVLVGYLALATVLVAFTSFVGWLVGDDLALREQAAAAAANERDRIARELHDGVAKSVSILALEAATAASRLPEEQRPELLRIHRLARLLSEELRAIVTDVRARGDARPLDEALRGLVQRHAPAELVVEGDLDRIGTLARFEVLRIVDEALTNAERHAGAQRMRARVAASRDHVTVEVEDDGRGIADLDLAGLPRSGRYGLLGIRERAEILHGSAELIRSALGGTLVRVDFPLMQP